MPSSCGTIELAPFRVLQLQISTYEEQTSKLRRFACSRAEYREKTAKKLSPQVLLSEIPQATVRVTPPTFGADFHHPFEPGRLSGKIKVPFKELCQEKK
jgi:hypothetical protein